MNTKLHQHGFSLVELMVATLLGLIVSYAVLKIYLAQTQLYKVSHSQDLILNTGNAITNLITPIIRSAGFVGCGTVTTAFSNLTAGGADPLGSFNTTPAMISGYSGGGATFTLAAVNPANSTTASNWTPALHSSLVGQVEQGNDVLIVFGAAPYSHPIGVTSIPAGSSSFGVQSTTGANIVTGQFGGVSDCVKTVIFQITGSSSTTISHAAGGGILANAQDTFPLAFQAGSQFMQLQQTSFFVGQGLGGQSSLMRGVLNGSTWTVQPIVPGVEIMKVQYGIGSNGVVTQYVAANAVPDWTQVYAVRLGFLIGGQPGSGSITTTVYRVLDTNVTVPSDNRVRHVIEMTIQLRNAIS